MQDSYSYSSQWVISPLFDLVVHVFAATFFFMTINEFVSTLHSSGRHHSVMSLFLGQTTTPILTAFIRDGTVFYVL